MPKVEEKRGVFEVEDGTTRIWVGALMFLIGIGGLFAYYLSEFRGWFDSSKYITGDVFLGLVVLAFLGTIIAYWGRAVYGRAVRDWDVNQEHEKLVLAEYRRQGMSDVINAPKMVVEGPGTGANR